jgi:hypothetical protein
MIRAASDTAPDFYADCYWRNGVKTPDRRLDGAVSLIGWMINAFEGIAQLHPTPTPLWIVQRGGRLVGGFRFRLSKDIHR